jgi:hypothetical protein
LATLLHRIRHPKHWKLAVVVWLVIAALVGFRLYLPTLVTQIVNDKLDEIPGYKGRIDGVSIHIWRGAYTIHGPYLKKEEGKIPKPFLEAKDVDISVNWPALLHFTIVGKVTFDKLHVNIVNGPSAGQKQTSMDLSGIQKLKELVPLRIDKLEVTDGEVHYGNPWGKPPFDIYLDDIELIARNLTNSDKISKSLVATLAAKGKAMKSGHFKVDASIDPYTKHPTFEVKLELKDLQVRELNAFAEDAAAVDIKTGTLGVFAEANAKEGSIHGYIKPLIHDLDIANIKNNATVLETLKGIAVEIVSAIFRNRPHEQIGVKVDFHGSLEKPEISIWDTIVSLLQNAFIKALEPKLEGGVAPKADQAQTAGGGKDDEKMKESQDKTKKEVEKKAAKTDEKKKDDAKKDAKPKGTR